MRALVADDSLSLRELMSGTLKNLGWQVVSAENGAKAWEILQKEKANLLVTDWVMPEMDGLTLCKKIRDAYQEKSSYLYIIVITSKSQKEDLVQVFESGADDYIAKPFDPDEFKARVSTARRIIELEKKHSMIEHSLLRKTTQLTKLLKERDCLYNISRMINDPDASYDDILTRSVGMILSAFKKSDNICVRIKANNNIYQSENFIETSHILTSDIIAGKSRAGVLDVFYIDDDFSGEDSPFNKEDKRFLSTVASRLGIFMERKKAEEEKKSIQSQLLQSEKMASIGQLAAGIAHEINNPTGFVSSNLKTLEDYHKDCHQLMEAYRKYIFGTNGSSGDSDNGDGKLSTDEIRDLEEELDIEYILNDSFDLISESLEGANRIKKIVQDMKNYAHPGDDKAKYTDINDNIESTLNVVWNELKYKAEIVKEYGDIPEVKCYPQQLNQVFGNLLVNAAQAIEEKGKIKISTSQANGHVQVIISDTGSGIKQEDLSKIFDPFFTTKPVGKGTGLGLNVVYNIIKKHNGTITAKSEIGSGTSFTIKLPVNGEE